MNLVSHLKCLICGKIHDPETVDYVCPDHGDDGVLDVVYDYDRIRTRMNPSGLRADRDMTMWRYNPLLPISPASHVSPLAVGWTPLLKAPRMASELGLRVMWIKDDSRQPTASLKDRASAIAVIKAREKGAKIVTTASTGNAAAALSGLCAAVGQASVIFVPETAPEAKIAQLLVYGAVVILVKGTYDEAFALCLAAAKAFGWYNRSTGYNPYMTEGKKTVAFEICEQLNWEAPDRIFVSVGDGCIIGGLHKGLKELRTLGWISRMPRLMGIQARGSSYLFDAWQHNENVLTKPPVKAETIADSISAGLPRDRIKAMAAVKESGGAFVAVSDEEILEAIPRLARGCGVFAEPAAAAAYAGLVRAVKSGLVKPEERVVVLNTGSGLKDVAGAMKAVAAGTEPLRVSPDLGELKALLAEFPLKEAIL